MSTLSRCGQCDHWQGDETMLNGECRKRPPEMAPIVLQSPTDARQVSVQVIHLAKKTTSDYWCSEHSAILL